MWVVVKCEFPWAGNRLRPVGTVVMASTSRRLGFQKNPRFTGWACTACGWAKPIPRIVESEGKPPKDIETDFANHECDKYPRKREDFS
jgi:hypothetical protein